MSSCKRLAALAGVLAMLGTACSDDPSTSQAGIPSPSDCGLEALAEESGPVDVSVWHFFPGVGSGAATGRHRPRRGAARHSLLGRGTGREAQERGQGEQRNSTVHQGLPERI